MSRIEDRISEFLSANIDPIKDALGSTNPLLAGMIIGLLQGAEDRIRELERSYGNLAASSTPTAAEQVINKWIHDFELTARRSREADKSLKEQGFDMGENETVKTAEVMIMVLRRLWKEIEERA